MDLKDLNKDYRSLRIKQRLEKLFTDFDSDEILVTSSFGSSSAILLYFISQLDFDVKVYFINTTYHFKQTLKYKKQLTKKFGLKVIDVYPEVWANESTREGKLWKSNPDLCCKINKVNPVDGVKEGKKIWISGLMSFQNAHRDQLNFFEEKGGLYKFYPLLDLTAQDVRDYVAHFDLPPHPLVAKGYASIGCEPCTQKGEGREGRWTGSEKTECGLHA